MTGISIDATLPGSTEPSSARKGRVCAQPAIIAASETREIDVAMYRSMRV
jgi:hypothetical protein